MPRPKLVSDEDVLSAALDVLAERGQSFTLTDLANRVGLSRATLIQRFGDRGAILRRMAAHEVALTRAWMESLPVRRGPEPLWDFLREIVGSMGAGEGFTARVEIAALEARDPELRASANERYSLIQNAIAARLPEGSPPGTAAHLHAVIAGATMQWVASDRAMALSAYVCDRLEWALANSNPPLR